MDPLNHLHDTADSLALEVAPPLTLIDRVDVAGRPQTPRTVHAAMTCGETLENRALDNPGPLAALLLVSASAQNMAVVHHSRPPLVQMTPVDASCCPDHRTNLPSARCANRRCVDDKGDRDASTKRNKCHATHYDTT